MAIKIRGNQDGKNGENQSYTIHGRGTVSRAQLVKEVKKGMHPHHHVIKVNGVNFARSDANHKRTDNIDPNQP